jgi:hypothetical protein
MKNFKNHFGCEPGQFVRHEHEDCEKDRVQFFQRFCDEQPMVIAFLTKYGVPYADYQRWTALSIRFAQQLWWNYLGNDVKVPQVTQASLERHYCSNKKFVETTGAPARLASFDELGKVCKTRPRGNIRLMILATLYDATQVPMIGPMDEKEAPDLVRDQDHMHALLGAVLEAFEEAAEQ